MRCTEVDFCQFPFRRNKSTGKETGKTHLCALVCWFAGTNDSSTKRLMFQVLSFFSHNFLQKWFQFTFL
jgi:hypothetical protein